MLLNLYGTIIPKITVIEMQQAVSNIPLIININITAHPIGILFTSSSTGSGTFNKPIPDRPDPFLLSIGVPRRQASDL
ncbi:hypothetical protein PISL3812_05013 [Talaromyces islandicus]|uniref:Uncharacterized protein n=1 Tax=Talaromyces islandicus TaxID=28573 RepID=A0A0U1LZ62_TALIS|nr:hypothetical protein PISL3812_05013 [Talaromyces islandicus]